MSLRNKQPGARGLTAAVLGVASLAIVAFVSAAGTGNAASASAPTNTSPPTISGTTTVGSTLTASSGSWSGTAPIDFAFHFRRCGAGGASCSDISGANQSNYTLRSADRGATLRVRVTAKNTDGSAQVESPATAVITTSTPKPPPPPPPPPTGCPSGTGVIDAAGLSLPARLLIDGQQASPSVVGTSTADLALRFHVSACGGRSVQNALVYATAVPFEQFNVPPEATTGADGWATLTLHKASRFPASRVQQLLAVFVRARKSGENLLAGVSTRRLVSFPVNLSG
jgi:hypothetical protein